MPADTLPKLNKSYLQLTEELEECWKEKRKEIEEELEAQKNPARLTDLEQKWFEQTIRTLNNRGRIEEFKAQVESLKSEEEKVAFVRKTIQENAQEGWTPEKAIRQVPIGYVFVKFLAKNNLGIMQFIPDGIFFGNFHHPQVQKRVMMAISTDFPEVTTTNMRALFAKYDETANRLDEKIKEIEERKQ